MKTKHLGEAILIAVAAHKDQYDKSEMPYICHPLRVMEGVRSISVVHMIVAVLHDTVEDTYVTLTQIEEIFGLEIKDAVDAITKRKNEIYKQYLKRVRQNHLARAVKIEDIRDNTLYERLELLSEDTREYLLNKYMKALLYL